MGGGLALLWRNSDSVTLLGYSNNYIDVRVTITGKPDWRLTCFYGFPERSRRQQAWDLLRDLKPCSSLPWAVIGDFNDIMSYNDKRGHTPHPNGLIRGFNTALSDCEFTDLGMRGHPFTWERGRGTDHWIEERLDRVVVSSDWRELYDMASVENLHAVSSDHSAIFLKLSGATLRRGCRTFKFESAWLLDVNCKSVVEASWWQSHALEFQHRIHTCGQDLCRDPGDVALFHVAEDQLRVLFSQEELYWRQRSKQLWLKDGDQNTKFFHRFASYRRKSNLLSRLRTYTGEWVEGGAMSEEVMRYYTDIFQTSPTECNFFNEIPTRITQDMNVRLLRPIKPDEIKNALFSMAPDKAPGPDGMTPSFYQSFWSTVGYDLIKFVSDCFIKCEMPTGLNVTNVVLIPKKKNPERVSDLRLIALCNVAYKVLAKVIANHMKEVLHLVISPTQSAFVPDRLISDNIIVAGEVGHYLRCKRTGTTGWAALKLDMAKAYDRMEWSFLEGMLSAMRDNDKEAKEVKRCLTLYCEASGQLVNFEKSSIMFSPNTTQVECNHVAGVFGVHQTQDFGRYLGLLSFLGRNKTIVFRYIEQKINDRVHMWTQKFLSRPGKEVLLKSIAQAIPIFTMSVFLLPLTVCESIEKLMSRFWWHTSGANSRGIHWLCWSRMAVPKDVGGLGFKRLREFNIALLAKQGWRLLIYPHSLVSRILKARYYPNTILLEANLGHNPSYIWRSILAGQNILREGVVRHVGDGKETSVWGLPWVADTGDPRLITPCVDELRNAQVCNLLNEDGDWDIDLLRDLFVEQDVSRIIRTPISPEYPDSWCWKGDIRGHYTVKHGYRMQTREQMTQPVGLDFTKWNQLWMMKTCRKGYIHLCKIGSACPSRVPVLVFHLQYLLLHENLLRMEC
ncbi:uncharacterized protein LOC116005889 [Ipomoea triloba]|uniref:uncharacterized protein LOC116005889 n=1 Tax=Ipomoea triloba TaxID=35885 RepID=UPI00125E8CEE|nr:uncharacterized protein LOC116005889 [Ipomoea triloba]